jgi:hypothetical protein
MASADSASSRLSTGAAWAAFDAWMGRRFTGNPRGISNDVEGAWEIFRARLAAKERIERRGDPIVESLDAKGYADLGPCYDPALIERIKLGFRRAVDDPTLTRERRSQWARQLVRPASAVPEATQLFDERMRAIVERYYGGPFKIYKFELRSNFHAPEEVTRGEEVYQNYWHVDDRPTSVLKLFINLTAVTDADGPFELLERDETRRLVRSGRFAQRSPTLEHETRPGARVRLVGGPGHAMLATTARVLHHACLVGPGGRRDLASFTFRPARRPLAADWHEKF